MKWSYDPYSYKHNLHCYKSSPEIFMFLIYSVAKIASMTVRINNIVIL